MQTNSADTENIVISVELNSGQEMKTILPDQLSQRLSGQTTGSIDASVNETSSLSPAPALLSVELASKLEVASTSFQLGEMNSGLSNYSSTEI